MDGLRSRTWSWNLSITVDVVVGAWYCNKRGFLINVSLSLQLLTLLIAYAFGDKYFLRLASPELTVGEAGAMYWMSQDRVCMLLFMCVR